MNLRNGLIAVIAISALIFGCGSKAPNGPPAPPPPPVGNVYKLSTLIYDDVTPGVAEAHLVSFRGGPVYLQFNPDGTGQGTAEADVVGVMETRLANGTLTQETVLILGMGSGGFRYTVDSVGVVSFNNAPSLWPFWSGGVLTANLYSYETRICYNPDCSEFQYLAHSWVRQ